MVVSIHLVYQLSVEISQPFELFFQEASHSLFLALILLLVSLFLGSLSEDTVDCAVGIHLEYTIRFFSICTTVFASANFSNVGTSPNIIFLDIINDVVFVDEGQTIETKFLLAGSG